MVFFFGEQVSPRASEEGTGGQDESGRHVTEKKRLGNKSYSFFFFPPFHPEAAST